MTKYLYICLILLLIPLKVVAQEHSLNIVTEDLPPLSFLNKSTGQIEGICTELIREVMKQTDIQYSIKSLPWARAYRTAKEEKNTLIYAIGRIPEREDSFIWLNNIFTINYFLYALKSKQSLFEGSNEDLKKKKIAVSLNSVNDIYLKKNGFENIVHTDSHEKMIELLQRNRIDLFASNDLDVKIYKHNHPKFKTELISVKGFNIPQVKIYFAINKHSDKNIIAQIQKGFAKIIASGHYHKILSPITEL